MERKGWMTGSGKGGRKPRERKEWMDDLKWKRRKEFKRRKRKDE